MTHPRPSLARPVRPSDAAGLVLIRESRRGKLEILLGRRHSRSGFLPDIYVVPGGRVERQDMVETGFAERLPARSDRDLTVGAGQKPALAFARCAVRETFEETGLMLARPAAAARANPLPAWRAFRDRGVAPAFDALHYIFRAITPTYMPRRFNTRFFLADGALAVGDLGGSGELTDLAWQPPARIPDLRLVDVTQALLKEAIGIWQARPPAQHYRPKLLTYRKDLVISKPLPAARSRAKTGGNA